MTKQRESKLGPISFPALRKEQDEVKRIINERIQEGKTLLTSLSTSGKNIDSIRSEIKIWDDYNSDLLMTLFTNEYFKNDYFASFFGMSLKEVISYKITRLESILKRLELCKNSNERDINDPVEKDATLQTNKVFIVHGHDEDIRKTVAWFLEKLKLEPVILQEQPNKGATVIEKLEQNSDVGYAIVLLTPDDEGRSKKSTEPHQPRARQNVILELGYFFGKLGRGRVCALLRGGIERPSDYEGIVYIPYDDHSGWMLKLAQELIEAGYPINMNDLYRKSDSTTAIE
ncbi:MAG: nucleotide-binding protein [Planctomycetota bacterium]